MSEDKNVNQNEDKNLNQNNEENLENELVSNENELDLEISEVNLETSNEKINDIENVEKEEKPKKNIKAIAITAFVGIVCLGGGFAVGRESGRGLPATAKRYTSKVIATVGETEITEKQLKQKMDPLFYINAKKKMTEDEIKAYEESMIDYMTTTEALYLEGKSEKIEATSEEIETEYTTLMASISQSFGITEEEYLKEFKMSKEEISKDLEKEVIASKYIGKASDVSEKEAQNYYNKNKGEFLKVRASHILILNTDEEGNQVSEEQKKKNKEKAEEVLKKAKSGEDFAKLAKEYSEDGSASNGGDLDFFAKGQMVEPFEKAAFSMKVGDISNDVVETDYGYHIIKKTDEAQDDFATIKEELKSKLSYEKQTTVVDNIMEKYNVSVKDR